MLSKGSSNLSSTSGRKDKRSSTGTLVNSEHTSRLTSLKSQLMWVLFSLSSKSTLFFIWDVDIEPIKGFSNVTRYLDNLHVAEFTELMIGLTGLLD